MTRPTVKWVPLVVQAGGPCPYHSTPHPRSSRHPPHPQSSRHPPTHPYHSIPPTPSHHGIPTHLHFALLLSEVVYLLVYFDLLSFKIQMPNWVNTLFHLIYYLSIYSFTHSFNFTHLKRLVLLFCLAYHGAVTF